MDRWMDRQTEGHEWVDSEANRQYMQITFQGLLYFNVLFFSNFFWRRCTFPGSCRTYEHFHIPKSILQKDIFNQDQVTKWNICIRERIKKDGRGREGQICMTVKICIVKSCPELLDSSSLSRIRTTWTFLIEHKLQFLYVFKINIESSINFVLNINNGFLNFCLKKGDESRYLKNDKKDVLVCWTYIKKIMDIEFKSLLRF